MEEVSLAEFDLNQLHDLKIGDVIEVPAFMPGLDPNESVVGMVKENKDDRIVIRFTYHGIFIGSYALNVKKNTWNKT